MSNKRQGWIVLDRTDRRWEPLYQTARRTRLESQGAYRDSGAVGAVNGYREMKKAGYVRCVPIHIQEEP